MLGAIIGDIVGSRFEFNNHRSTDFELFAPGCDFTDDTICTIAVADALLTNATVKQPLSSDDFAKSLHTWCRNYPYPKGAYGSNFARWVVSDNPQPYNSFGNGSAMRVSPCAWFSLDEAAVLNAAHQSALCTHNHPEGIRGAMCVAHCIYLARLELTKEAIRDVVTTTYGYNLDTRCDVIRQTNQFNETCQVTVPQAIQCFLESTDFESAIRLAVSIGGDSDTIAAMSGSIAEAYYYHGITDNILRAARGYLPNALVNKISDFYYYFLSERAFRN